VDSFRKIGRIAIAGLLLSIAATQVHALESLFGEGPSPLPVEEAFGPALSTVNSDEVLISFEIAEGYYLYQKKMSFASNNPSVVLGAPIFPEPLVHEDDYFGKSNVYRGPTTMSVPLSNASAIKDFVITVGYQGCADMGLCYPPTKTDFSVALPAATTVAQSTTPKAITPQATAPIADVAAPAKIDINDLFKNKAGLDAADARPLLHPTEAFVPSVVSAGDGLITVLDVDRGVMQNDAYFGDVEILREVASARIKLDNSASLSSAKLQIHSQGCADIGVCFPPETTSLPVSFTNTGNTEVAALTTSNTNKIDPTQNADINAAQNTALANVTAVTQTNTADLATNPASTTTLATQSTTTNASTAATLPVTEQDKLTRLLEAGNLGFIALAFYGAGLLLAFTACMYPMIPILSSLIVGQGKKLSTTKAFSLSVVYVMSMASVFAIVGILVGLSGYNIQPLFQNPWVLSAFAGLFVLLALSMFGLFQLQMPSAIQSKVSEISNKQQGGSFTGVAVMGMLSALIVGPCVTPPLVAALAYIAKTGDATIGGIALFAIGIGMGTPLLFIGTSLGRFMPKAGGWMETTQRIFGVVLLAVAIYLVSRFLPGNVIMMLSAMLAIFTGVYFGATDRLDNESRGTQRLGKSVGLVALVYGIVLMVGALAGNTSMLSPLKGVLGQQVAGTGATGTDAHVSFKRIKSLADLDNELVAAKAQNRPVMLDFYADWCVSCKEMEAFTFPDTRVKEQLTDAVLIQADVTKNDDDDKALLKQFDLFGPPAIILYDRSGAELTAGRIVGYMPADKFSQHLQAYLNQ